MVQNKFPSDDPYVLSTQLVAAAANTRTDLNVILVESAQLQSTNVFLQGQALTNNTANPVSAVTVVGQQVIGSGVSDGTIQPDGNPCFLGCTPFTYWDGGVLKSIPISQFYGYEIGKLPFALSFTETGEQVRGRILSVSKKVRDDYLYVTFSDHVATNVAPDHRYWDGTDYTAIKHLEGKEVYNLRNEPVQVLKIDHVFCPKGIEVYNVSIETCQNYCANGHWVHNVKPIDPFASE